VADSGWWVYQLRGIANGHTDGKKPEAMADFDKALAIAARTGNTDIAVAVISSIADTIGLQPAIDRCEREAAKGDNQWRVILTYLYFSTQDYAKAESTIEKVLSENDKLTPREKETALSVAGQVYMLAQDFKKADEAYQKLLAMVPDDMASLNNLACLWVDGMDPPNPAKALTYSTKAFDLAKKAGIPDANIMDTHGWVLVCNQQLDDGINYLQASLERSATGRGPAMDTHYHMGMAMLKKNRGAEALRSLEKARKMLEERKNNHQPTDVKLETRVNDGIVKAKQMVANTSAVTNVPAKP
jgi:tetratricopeptide (TPR) repeat protein